MDGPDIESALLSVADALDGLGPGTTAPRIRRELAASRGEPQRVIGLAQSSVLWGSAGSPYDTALSAPEDVEDATRLRSLGTALIAVAEALEHGGHVGQRSKAKLLRQYSP